MNRIIAGTMTWGSWGKKFSTNEIADYINQCIDLGVYTFDHADIYGGYTTETDFGKGLQKTSIARDKMFHISKCGIQYPCAERALSVKHYNYSKQHIIQSAEQSIKNLNIDYLDLLLLHRPSPLMDVSVISDAFSSLEKDGKVRAFGVSNFTSSQMELLNKEVTIQWNQVECSLSESQVMFDGTLDYHTSNNIGTMAWSPLGDYFKEENQANERVKPILKSIAEKYKATPDQILLAWLMTHPANIHPVVGTTNIKRMESSLHVENIRLSHEEWFLLLEAQWGHKVP